jgi:ATP-dependent DNA ligase
LKNNLKRVNNKREMNRMDVKEFCTLYGKDKCGKVKEWNIKVEKYDNYSIIFCTYGLLEGKKTECRIKIEAGKNIGKKNETTHFEQAILNAKSKWTKKKEDGYTETKEANVQTSQQLLPMLAQDYKKHGKNVKYPMFVQPKLDGYRMIYDNKSKRCYTRTGKEYNTGLYNTELFRELEEIEGVLDGELYVHDKEFNFEQYGILRKQKITSEIDKKRIEKIEYHVYDIIDEKMTFEERNKRLQELVKGKGKIKIVDTYTCGSESELEKYHEDFLEKGYEGTMIRSREGKYLCKFRSVDLLKYKNFDDNEFKIVDYTYEADTTGKDANLIVWICETVGGLRFNVQSKGTREERRELYENAGDYIGKKLWVQHCGMTIDGIPRFPKTYRNGREAIREGGM